ncbi:unnamed protein product [Mycena citricolor]|uniref:Uncharacterized protein n=1 Tax=Mycena citricolor TaxID=2018698 RepID=A0AAD2HSQ0_9AGAR|nr:unnamed protein product [Mycena citricolor]
MILSGASGGIVRSWAIRTRPAVKRSRARMMHCRTCSSPLCRHLDPAEAPSSRKRAVLSSVSFWAREWTTESRGPVAGASLLKRCMRCSNYLASLSERLEDNPRTSSWMVQHDACILIDPGRSDD